MMSAGGSGAIGPVSVRYAAQIRELLHAQAMQRMAADQEAARARADADRAAPVEAAQKAEETRKPLQAKVEPPEPALLATFTKLPDTSVDPKPAPSTTPHLVDIQA
jgi:hypothetical protein